MLTAAPSSRFGTDWSRVPNDASFSISDLADAFDITPRAIRFYEDQGMLSPDRQGQNRVYSKRDYARLSWILRGKRSGFSLSEIREMLDLYDLGDGRRRQRQVTIERCRAKIAALQEQRADIDFIIDELEQFCRLLESGVSPDAQTG